LTLNQHKDIDKAVTDKVRVKSVDKIISFMFISYNRSELLAKALASLRKAVLRTELSAEFVVADDGSTVKHQKVIRSLGFDIYSVASVNMGLGANQNRGLSQCKGEFVFQVQDDWIFVGEPTDLIDAIQILHSDPEIGIVQLTEVGSDLPSERRVTQSGIEYDVFKNDRLPWNRYCGVRPYSDCPHVKSSRFINDLGPYLEGVKMGVTENDFKRRVANQGRWRVAKMCSRKLFVHIGAEHSLNPGGKRNKLFLILHKIPLVGKLVDKFLRLIWKKADHFAAIITSRILS
jgi:glycosyltransferase involved in cell wall biosynthesis